MRTAADMPRRRAYSSRRFRIGVLVAVVVIILVLTSARGVAQFYTDYLWFKEVGFTSVFRGVLVTKLLLAVVFSVIFFALLFGNLLVSNKTAPEAIDTDQADDLVVRYRGLPNRARRWICVVLALVFALFGGISTNSEWNDWDLYRYHAQFGIKDPQFHNDYGFYVFQLPFIKFLIGWFFSALVVTFLVSAVLHYLNGGIRVQGAARGLISPVKTHLSVLLGVMALVQAVNYYYERLELVLSTNHLVDGATATSVHANLPADTLLIAIAIIAAALFLYNIRLKGWLLPVVAVALWALVWVIVGNIYPALYQALRVSPSESTVERPYIARNIAATRYAYGLSKANVINNFDSPQAAAVQPSQINGNSPQAIANRDTLANVQLLDPARLVNTFDKYQALRTYYQFNDLNVDRYDMPGIDGPTLKEMIVAIRELNGQVPSGFVNQHLEYTHGYGAVAAPASQIGLAADGTPNFSLQDIPPAGAPTLDGRGSEVYFGEGGQENGYVIADSKQPELDYEDASGQEKSTHYAGRGGVQLGGFFRRLAFAISFGDPNIILSGQITSHSRIIYNRNIAQRVQKGAPFLKYDADPYPVVLNGQIYWIADAYTTTDNIPYSQQANTNRIPSNSGLSSTFNYVRNSVKVVVNAYTGKTYYFVVDPHDPIIRVYERAFPDLFTPRSKADKLIPGITDHWRYPEDIFKVQTNMYGRYHLTDPSAFYNQAFAWSISIDPGSGRPGQNTAIGITPGSPGQPAVHFVRRLDPEYEVAHLPGQTQQKFLIVQPFMPRSPSNKQQNLTAMMVASSDPNDYGQLNVYETPPGLAVDGPQLITNTINSNTSISKELTLLNEGGSEVELGRVVIVPLDQTLLYVQPVYVQSTTNNVPTLKDVVVVYNGTAYHSSNTSLDAALCQITNPNGTRPFGIYCQTRKAKERSTLPTSVRGKRPAGSKSPKSPPTTAPTTAPPTSAPGSGSSTVSRLLNDANQAFASAKSALARQDLAQYQQDVNRANADLNKVRQLLSKAAKPKK